MSTLSAAPSGSPLFRKAGVQDLDQIAAIYDRIHTLEEAGPVTTGWVRHIYPTRDTALAALKRDGRALRYLPAFLISVRKRAEKRQYESDNRKTTML